MNYPSYPEYLVDASIAREYLEDLQDHVMKENGCEGRMTMDGCDEWECPFFCTSRSGYDSWCTLDDAICALEKFERERNREDDEHGSH